MKKYYFTIETNWLGRPKRIATTFEEAFSHIGEYNEEWTDRGTCRIYKVDEELRQVEEWRYWKGKLEEHQILVDRTWKTLEKNFVRGN